MNQLEYYKAVGAKYHLDDLKKNIFIIGTPNHGNLGDHAIWYATQRILEEFDPDANVVDINMEEVKTDMDALFHIIRPEDIIVLQGGGNLGNYYMDDEMIRRYVIARFANNRIIMFPQTVNFSDDEEGKRELEKSIQIYQRNQNLILFARDEKSCQFLREHFNNQIDMLPDVVLSLNCMDKKIRREGALICLRSDRESARSEEEKQIIEQFLREKYETVHVTDTEIAFDGDKEQRVSRLEEKLGEFQRAEVVVTDRLHGMVFAAITGTPCIIFSDINTKIRTAYEYLKQFTYLKLAESVQDLESAYRFVVESDSFEYEETVVKDQFMKALEKYMSRPLAEEQCPDAYLQNIFETAGYWNSNYYETVFWHEKLKDSYRQAEKRVEDLSADGREWEEKYHELEDWHSDLKRSNEQLEKELADSHARENGWEEKYHELEDWHNKLKQSYEDKIAEMQELERCWSERYQKLEAEKEEEDRELVESRIKTVEWREKYLQLEAGNSKLEESFAEMQEKYSRMEKQYEELSEKVRKHRITRLWK